MQEPIISQLTQDQEVLEISRSVEGVPTRKRYFTCFDITNLSHHISSEDIITTRLLVNLQVRRNFWEKAAMLVDAKTLFDNTASLLESRKVDEKNYEEHSSQLSEKMPGWQ